jgi:hypothetical protein
VILGVIWGMIWGMPGGRCPGNTRGMPIVNFKNPF